MEKEEQTAAATSEEPRIISPEEVSNALEKGVPLFRDGDTVSQEVYTYLVINVTIKQKKILLADLSKYEAGSGVAGGKLKVITNCCKCGKEMANYLSRNGFNGSQNNYSLSYMHLYHERLFNWRNNSEIGDKVKGYLDSHIKTMRNEDSLPVICESCYNWAVETYSKDWHNFYDNPLKWVNEHDPLEKNWKWSKVERLYQFPRDFALIPKGWKYCGVQFNKEGRSYEKYEDNYYQWKTIRDKTVRTERCTPIKDYIFNKRKEANLPDDENDTRVKAFSLAEVLLSGLCSDTDLSQLMDYVAKTASLLAKDAGGPDKNKYNCFGFGKYKGYPVHLIIDIDKDYITWLLDNVQNFHLASDELLHYQGLEWRDIDAPQYKKDFVVIGDVIRQLQEKMRYGEKQEDEQ